MTNEQIYNLAIRERERIVKDSIDFLGGKIVERANKGYLAMAVILPEDYYYDEKILDEILKYYKEIGYPVSYEINYGRIVFRFDWEHYGL